MPDAPFTLYRIAVRQLRKDEDHMTAFPHSHFFKGIGRALDLGGVASSRRFSSRIPEEADGEALWQDWQAVGGDLHAAMRAAFEAK